MPVAFLSSAMRAPNCRNSSVASASSVRIATNSRSTSCVVEAVGRRERREAGGVQDLVRVGTPDAGDRALVAQQRVQLPAALQRHLQRLDVERRLEGLRPEPCELGCERLLRVQADAHLAARRALGDDEVRPVLERHAQDGTCGALGAGLDERHAPVRHEVHDERRSLIGLEEHPLRAPAGVHEAMSDEARKGRIVRLPDREVHEHGRGDRGASDEWIERLRERLQLGQLWHLAAVSGELPHARRPTCNGAPSRRVRFTEI